MEKTLQWKGISEEKPYEYTSFKTFFLEICTIPRYYFFFILCVCLCVCVKIPKIPSCLSFFPEKNYSYSCRSTGIISCPTKSYWENLQLSVLKYVMAVV